MVQENVKKLSFDELNNVAGGTLREVNQLSAAFRQSKVFGHLYSYLLANLHEATLDKIGIVAKTSEGFCGIGAGSVNNTYKEKSTGKMILHEEVIEYIRTGRKSW
jgi:hypothetical protein